MKSFTLRPTGGAPKLRSQHLWALPTQRCYIPTLWHKNSDAKISQRQTLIKRPKDVVDGWWVTAGKLWEQNRTGQDRTQQAEWTSPSLVRVWNGALDAFSYPGTLNTHEQLKAAVGRSSEGGSWRCRQLGGGPHLRSQPQWKAQKQKHTQKPALSSTCLS